jgi:hypothetical protein
MKRILFFLFFVIPAISYAQTAEEVVEKYSRAVGGLDSFSRVKTAKITGTSKLAGQEFPMTAYVINGKAMRAEIDVMGQMVINAYTNGTGWMVNPLAGSPTPSNVEGSLLEDFKLQSYLASQLMNYKVLGGKIEYRGQEKVDGVDTHKIMFTASDGRVTYYNITVSDALLLRATSNKEMMGQVMEIETWFSDYKTVNGLKFAMAKDTKIAGEVFQSLITKSIELNVPIDEKIFKKE